MFPDVKVTKGTANLIAVLLCGLFLVMGSLFIWRPGIQTDEVLFSGGIYGPFAYPISSIRIFKRDFVVMVMTYVGAVKAQLWTPVFALWGVSPVTIRLPAVALGAVSVWLFYRLTSATLSLRAALAGCALLATDPMYLLTARWDWGPVVLQHLFLISGMLGVARYAATGKLLPLGLGFFAFGLAIWDKALFSWSLFALGLAALLVFYRDLLRSLRPAPIATAAVCFALGAFPLIRYNVRNQWVTFRSNAVWSTDNVEQKAHLLRATLNSSAIGGSIMRDEWDGPPAEPQTATERLVVAASAAAGHPRRSIQTWLLGCAILTLPLIWRQPERKAVNFSLLFSVALWAQMAVLKDAGGGLHHTILLWPMPTLAIASGLSGLSRRWKRGQYVLTAAIVVACVINLLVTCAWYTNLIRQGGAPAWSEAIYTASERLEKMQPGKVCPVEWGFWDALRVLHQGRLQLCVTIDPVTEDDRRYARLQIAEAGTVYITHVPPHEIEPGRAERFVTFAASEGYRKAEVHRIPDANGRNLIEIFRLEPVRKL